MAIQTRPLGTTNVTVSEIGFGVWTVATGTFGDGSREAASALIREAFDLGVTFFSTSDAFGSDGYGEQLVRDALSDVRDHVTIATTFGAGFDGERAFDWSTDNVKRSLERSIEHLGTDSIDVWQLHEPRMDALHDDALWDLLGELRSQGIVKAIGTSMGASIGGTDEGLYALEHRDIDCFTHVFNMLEQEPGRAFNEAAGRRDIAMLVRGPHAGGLLDSRGTSDSEGLQKLEALQFLLEDREGATMGQLALKWLLADPQNASVLPDIMTMDQLREFAAAPDIEHLDADELGEIETLFNLQFGVEQGDRLVTS